MFSFQSGPCGLPLRRHSAKCPTVSCPCESKKFFVKLEGAAGRLSSGLLQETVTFFLYTSFLSHF